MWPGVLLSSVSFVSDLMDLVTTTVPEDPQVPHSKLQTTTTGSENIHIMSSCSASCWTSSYCMEALIVYCYITRLNLLRLPADTPAHEWRNRMPSTAELTKAYATTAQLEKNSFRSKTEGSRRVCEDKGTNARVRQCCCVGLFWHSLNCASGKRFSWNKVTLLQMSTCSQTIARTLNHTWTSPFWRISNDFHLDIL